MYPGTDKPSHLWMLHFSMPLSEEDRANYDRAHACRVMMPFWLAYRDWLSHPTDNSLLFLRSRGAELTLRIEEPRVEEGISGYYTVQGSTDIVNALSDLLHAGIMVEAVVIGNEPEGEFDLKRGSASWGNQRTVAFPLMGGRAEAHALAVSRLHAKIMQARLPVKVVSPGWALHNRTVPRAPALPGRGTWYRWTGDAYDECHGNGAHLYLDNYLSEEDQNRALWQLHLEEERCHKPIWLLEVGVFAEGQNQMYRMLAYQDLLMQLLDPRNGGHGGALAAYCPFVCNGTGLGWKAQYLLTEPLVYNTLGTFLSRN